MAIEIAYLEMPVTHICSLHCDGCSAYSNYNIKRTVPLHEAREWIKAWSRRVVPKQFRILGGEPFLHPNLPEIMLTARQFWPATHLQVCTNGLNLDRHPVVPYILAQPNCSLTLSIHSRDAAYLERLNVAIAKINTWITDLGVSAHTSNNVDKWNRFYRRLGREMEPFKGDVLESWKVCHSQHCCNIVDNRLWKCPQIGNLHIVAEKFDLHQNPSWAKYLNYKGIGLEASDEALLRWLRARNGPESICDMCPTHLDNYEKDIYNVEYDQPGVERLERLTNHPPA